MLTLCAVEWSSLAADPHDRLMDEEIWAEMEDRLLFLVQTHDWSSVTPSGHLSFVKYWMLRLMADLIHVAWEHCLLVRCRELRILGIALPGRRTQASRSRSGWWMPWPKRRPEPDRQPR